MTSPSEGQHKLEFSDLLTETTEAFRKSGLKGHSTTTFDDIQTKFEFADKRRQVINKICEDLAEEIEMSLKENPEIIYIGFDEVRLNVMNKEKDNDSLFIECDIWESLEEPKVVEASQ